MKRIRSFGWGFLSLGLMISGAAEAQVSSKQLNRITNLSELQSLFQNLSLSFSEPSFEVSGTSDPWQAFQDARESLGSRATDELALARMLREPLEGLAAHPRAVGLKSKIAAEIQRRDKDARENRSFFEGVLPLCPCTNPDWKGARIGDGWASEGAPEFFHPGATECFRSYAIREVTWVDDESVTERYLSSLVDGGAGQQCCYDVDGALITAGGAAGTPDRVAVAAPRVIDLHFRQGEFSGSEEAGGEDSSGEVITISSRVVAHGMRDVIPWRRMGWASYNEIWIPSPGADTTGKACPDRYK